MKDIRTCAVCSQSYEQSPEFAMLDEAICDPCDRAREAKSREEIRMQNVWKRWANVIPPDYMDTDMNHKDYVAQEPVRRMAAMWMRGTAPAGQDLKMFMAFIGESGRCKTRIVAMISKNIIEDGFGLTWMTSSKFQWATRNQYDRDFSQEAKRLLAAAQNAPWLVFDDLGNLDSTKAIAKSLYDLLELRVNQKKPMIWTSNESPDEILASNDVSEKDRARVISRLIGNTNIINI